MKSGILLFFIWGFTYTLTAQTIIVKDQESQQPVELAVLTSEEPRRSATTNAIGQADISGFAGSDVIVITALGYQSMIISYDQLSRDGFNISLQSSGLNLETVVVTGSRWRQKSGEVPSKIIAISAREIALQNPQTAADLLGISGKVFIQKSQQGGGSPMIRGFATNRLLYSVDGVRMNSAIFRSGNIQNVINLDPFATESTEVLFGPGSVIYGSDAIGGVMSFQTLNPKFSLDEKPLISGKFVTRYSSANSEKTGHFDVNIGWKKWSLLSSISSWNYDHLRQGNYGPEDYIKPYFVLRQNDTDVVITQDDPLLQIPSAYRQMNVMQKIRFSPNEKWDFQYGYHFSNTSPYGRYDRHNRVRNGTARHAEWNYGPQLWQMHNLNITHSGANVAYDQLSLRIAQQTFKESRIDRNLNSVDRNTQTEKVLAYSANLDFTKKTSASNTLFYGFEYVLNDVESSGMLTDISNGVETVGASRYPSAAWTSMAIYINDAYNLTQKLTLQGGMRYNHIFMEADFSNNLPFFPFPFSTASINNGNLTGSIGAVFKPSESWVLSTNLGTAFRSPNVDDLGKVFDSEPGTVTVPNPDLKPEYAYNADLGIAKVFGNRLKIDLTGFYTVLQNALVRRNYTLNGQDSLLYLGEMARVQAIQNAAVANVYGLQAGLEWKIGGGFTFSSDLNIQIGEEELDDGTISTSRHAAPMFGVSRLEFKAGKLSLQLYSMYQAERKFEDLPQEEKSKDEIYAKDANGNNYAPSWYTLNFKAMYQLSDTFSISTGLENLTDQRYRPFSSGISAPGINFMISLKAGF
ncbi:MAG: TonB-dependent receptor [Saprospiraceae bacterium]|nr:TonB-dependent receptor [Saprospiraceae bacterium]